MAVPQKQVVLLGLKKLLESSDDNKFNEALIFIGEIINSPIDIEIGSQIKNYKAVHTAAFDYVNAKEDKKEAAKKNLENITIAFTSHILEKKPGPIGLGGAVVK